jgi:hypothetical protein
MFYEDLVDEVLDLESILLARQYHCPGSLRLGLCLLMTGTFRLWLLVLPVHAVNTAPRNLRHDFTLRSRRFIQDNKYHLYVPHASSFS